MFVHNSGLLGCLGHVSVHWLARELALQRQTMLFFAEYTLFEMSQRLAKTRAMI